jgi:hypothetical protein
MKISTASADEQNICVNCGFCCDGTLFGFAELHPGERGNLPEKIEKQSYSREGKDRFILPCGYFDGKCTIYHEKKAMICGAFRCQLLIDFSDGRISLADALGIILEAKKMRHEVFEQFRKITGKEDHLYFRQLLVDLENIQKTYEGNVLSVADAGNLVARCNILQTLLIRHFRPADDFNELMVHE